MATRHTGSRRGWRRGKAAPVAPAASTPVESGEAPAAVDSLKLQKMLAQAGLGSRRDMEAWVREGRITVNGKPAHIGMRVAAGDIVKVDKRVVRWSEPRKTPRIIVYHKPEGEISSRDDPQERPTVFDSLPRMRGARWLSVGRLDFNTCGLLVFTTSGEIANRFTHPRFEVEREYAVRTLGRLTNEAIERLKSGIDLDDGRAHCESVADEGGEGANHWYRIVVKEGRNRVVRRMFDALGLTVSRLMRTRFGIISLPPQLKRGQVHELSPDEVRRVMSWLGIAPAARPPVDRGSAETRNRRRRSSPAR
jgi:23S rRNA pseudouridine2605 synthase